MTIANTALLLTAHVLVCLAPIAAAAADPPTTQPQRSWLSRLRASNRDLLEEIETTDGDPSASWRRPEESPQGRWDAAVLEVEPREEEIRDRPGPPLAGKRDHEPLRWMDVESLRALKAGADYRVRHYFDAGADGRGGDLGFTRHELAVRAFEEELGMGVTQAFLKTRVLDLHDRAWLPRPASRARRFPGQLADIQVSGMVPIIYLFGDLSVAFGSASDRPFASDHEMVADITWATGGFASGQEDSLVFFFNWQNNRDFLNAMPIPGLIYRHKHLDSLTLVAGFPYESIAWRPCERVELSASYVFPQSVYTEAAFLAAPNLRLHAGFEWTNQRYYLHDRHDVRDRLWYDEKRLTAGLRWNLNEHVYLDVGGGWAFDRSWWEGRTLQDDHHARIGIDDGPFAGIQFHARF